MKAHLVWTRLITGLGIAIFITMYLFKFYQRHLELLAETGNTPPLGTAIGEGFLRRTNDPSNWTVLSVILAASLCTAGVHRYMTAHPTSLPRVSRWDILWWLIASAINLTIYLVRTFVEGEGLWFAAPQGVQGPVHPTIERLMDFEGAVYVIFIVAACGLVPIARMYTRALVLQSKSITRDSRKSASRFASLSLLPPSLLIAALLINKAVIAIAQKNVEPMTLPLAMGIIAGIVLTWPILWTGVDAWIQLKKPYGLTVYKATAGHVIVFLAITLFGAHYVITPRALLHPKILAARPIAELAARALFGMGFVTLVPLLWADLD